MADIGRRDPPDVLMAGAFAVDSNLEDVAKALSYEANAPKLRRDLADQLRKAVDPAVGEARGRIASWRSSGLAHKGQSLRGAITAGMKVEARLSGKATGVRVRVSKPNVRGFRSAPRRTNRAAGWRHPVYGDRDAWVHQEGPIGWFDNSMQDRASEYLAAVQRVIGDTAERIRSAT